MWFINSIMAPENIPIQLLTPSLSPRSLPLFTLVNAKKNWCKFAQFAWRKFHLNSVHNSIYIYREKNRINRNVFNKNSKEREEGGWENCDDASYTWHLMNLSKLLRLLYINNIEIGFSPGKCSWIVSELSRALNYFEAPTNIGRPSTAI